MLITVSALSKKTRLSIVIEHFYSTFWLKRYYYYLNKNKRKKGLLKKLE